MPPPPADSAVSRLFLGPALRAQSDRRLVSLVREGYENAFEEIVRRYGRPLARYAGAIVPSHRAEDVTQDAFSKALLALRGTEKEIELRPWLYRIVRNTALNDLRDQPPATAQLHEGIDGVESPAEAAERREEVSELMERLRDLPEPQRAAIVMRELEGLSHEEIAAALGLSGGGARQTIYRARRSLREGFGLLIPVPLLHLLLAGGGGGATAGAALGGAGAAGAASAGGAGAGVGLKAGIASVVVAGSVAGGVAIKESSGDRGSGRSADTVSREASGRSIASAPLAIPTSDDSSGSGRGEGEQGDDRGRGRGGDDGREDGGGPGPSANSGPGGGDLEDDEGGSEHSGSGGGSGSGESGSSGRGSPNQGSGSSGSGSSGSGSGGSGGGGDSSGPGGGEPEPPEDD